MKARVTDYLLYRWRYRIGYTVVALVVVTILAIAALYVPGALRSEEIAAALHSGQLSGESIDPMTVINLPYYVLQRVGFVVFGVSTLTIKLPSIVLGALTALGALLLTRTWFRRNVAVLATVLAVTTTQFLFLIQDGTPAIMFSFITIWLLTAGINVTRNRLFTTFWKVVGCVLMATALYLPLGIYVVLALFITASFHPHIRHTLRRTSRSRMLIALALGLVSVAPLVYASILNHDVALTLLGIPTTTLDIIANLTNVGQELFGFFSTSDGSTLRPLYSLGLVILMTIGVYKLLTVKYTARSYITLLIAIFLLPLVTLNPEYLAHLYPLAILMIATGIAMMITNWYKLFPRNPYARIAGLLPLSIFVIGLMFSGVMRYMNNYSYNPHILAHYSTDLRIIDDYLANNNTNADNTWLVTTKDEFAFYELVARHDKRFTASTTTTKAPDTMLLTHDAYAHLRPDGNPSDILTNRMSGRADRLYVYTTKTKK